MGGLGSGRTGWRGLIERYGRRLDVNWLNRQGMLRQRGWTVLAWLDEEGEPETSIGITFSPEELELEYTVNPGADEAEKLRYCVPVRWTPCTYGGERPWLICPRVYCGRRVGKLYLRGKYFVCRHCTGAAYASQNETKEDRLMRKARKIRRRLGGSADPSERMPWKPKGMHWRTYWRLRREAQEAEYQSMVLGLESMERLARRLRIRLD